MDEQSIRRLLEGGGGWPGRLARAGLWIPGKLYGGVMEFRRMLYRADLCQHHRLPAPTVSVGNLTAGGSGKTPFVIMLSNFLSEQGFRPGILLRGYRDAPGQGSDEALLYRNACPGAVVETGADRVASAARAAQAGANVFLLDDGFQHLRVRRDLDIVLVDATSPWGGGNTIPGGLLREPKSALDQAGVVVITRSDQRAAEFVNKLSTEIEALIYTGPPVFTARHDPTALRTLAGEELSLSRLSGKKVITLAGIARPEAFVATLRGIGAEVVAEYSGKDHDAFSPEFLRQALDRATALDAVVVTTEKDGETRVYQDMATKTADYIIIWTLAVAMRVNDAKALQDRVLGVLRHVPNPGNTE